MRDIRAEQMRDAISDGHRLWDKYHARMLTIRGDFNRAVSKTNAPIIGADVSPSDHMHILADMLEKGKGV